MVFWIYEGKKIKWQIQSTVSFIPIITETANMEIWKKMYRIVKYLLSHQNFRSPPSFRSTHAPSLTPPIMLYPSFSILKSPYPSPICNSGEGRGRVFKLCIPQEFLVLIIQSTREGGIKAEVTLEAGSCFGPGTPGLRFQLPNHYDNWEDVCQI